MKGKIIATLQDNGTAKLDARGMEGSEEEILAELNALAADIGGDLTVEKHIEGNHVHHSHDGKHYHKH